MAYFKVFFRYFPGGVGGQCRRTLAPGQIFEARSFSIQSKSSVLQYRVTCEDGRIILNINCMKIAGGGGVDAVR